jgi:hypothetical protein
MHPVRQNISGHSEVCGDIVVSPAVYNPALQEATVVISQIQEEGAKPIRCSMHSADLGRDGHQIAVPPGCPPVLLFVSSRFRPPTYLGIHSSPTEGPGNTKAGRRLGRRPLPGRVGVTWATVW